MRDDQLLWICDRLMRVRPTQLGAALGAALGLKRRIVPGPGDIRYFADPVSLLGLELLKTGRYEPYMTELIQSLLKPGDTFIDLGANEGYFSILAAKTVGGHGRVVAIEPQSRLQAVLAENQRLNGLINITVSRAAVSDCGGETSLALRPSTHSGASSMFPYWRLGWRAETVRTLTLDQLFAEQSIASADLMKVDCEGAEKLVFSGNIEVLRSQRIGAIILEYHPQIIGGPACAAIDRWLSDAGYTGRQWRGQVIYVAPGARPGLLPDESTAFVPPWAG